MPAFPPGEPAGEYVERDGELCFRITGFDHLDPFLMSVPSANDLWMYVASGGGLTAGRVDADGSLFPYETVDRLHDAHHCTGPVTVVRVERDGADILWEPLTGATQNRAFTERFLSKNLTGNQVRFEEIRTDLGVGFGYRWAPSDRFGWVRTATLENLGPSPLRLRVLDGLRNLMPWGVPLSLQQQASNLVDAYKKSEIDGTTGLGIFALTARITDRAEAAEVLRANVVWCSGLRDFRVHLASRAIDAFREGAELPGERILDGARGNYLVSTAMVLEPGERASWHLAGDTGLDHRAVSSLRRLLHEEGSLASRVEESLADGTRELRRLVGSADGIQLCREPRIIGHHFANVLFNVMRGGVFDENHVVGREDLRAFLGARNRPVADRRSATLDAMPERLLVTDLQRMARDTGDTDFERLAGEYLPLYFSRRHGDPSRPWNRFSIRTRRADGERMLRFEGNWRDIFQNWEALATSFPGFLPAMVTNFLDASTVDGYNPYRVTSEGVEWEVPVPDDPWSNIGYWGDHQIVYLHRLLLALDAHHPAALGELLGRRSFSTADVPYRILPYREMLLDPARTIRFDAEAEAGIQCRVDEIGGDGRLRTDASGQVRHVTLLEKLLVPVLARLSNFVPGAGIWMNTQRPEWNDANNALASGGVSVVTACQLRAHLEFLSRRLPLAGREPVPVTREVDEWFGQVEQVFAGGIERTAARQTLDTLGEAFSRYREKVYAGGSGESVAMKGDRVLALLQNALSALDRTIRDNRRPDGLYHTYHRMEFLDDGLELRPLPEMLEGQVAVLASGVLEPEEAVQVLDALFDSTLHDADRRGFLLQPERELPGFLDKNIVPGDAAREIGLLADLLSDGDLTLMGPDAEGVLRFSGDLGSREDLDAALDRLDANERWTSAVARDREAVGELFEQVFDHACYTGRSGVMYAYEGLGCIYWHMVAKLLLAVQENWQRAIARGGDGDAVARLRSLYRRIRSGIGYEKSVVEYGAFPTDPYSHTPASGGARQPGMTGQVKEEILTRRGELGVSVERGVLHFGMHMLEEDEFLASAARFGYFDVSGSERFLDLPPRTLAFTVCQVPVVYAMGTGEPGIEVALVDGSRRRFVGASLDEELSLAVLGRTGRVDSILVQLPPTTPASR